MSKISQMIEAGPITGNEHIEIVQNGDNKKVQLRDIGLIGRSAYDLAVSGGYVGTIESWLVSLKGVKGDTGPKGDQGVAGEQGAGGTVGLQGPKGDRGDTGSQGLKGDKGDAGDTGSVGETGAQGPVGEAGSDGASAYDLAVDNGFVGTEQDWLDQLNGETGPQGDIGDMGETGLQGEPGPQGELGPQGEQGLSAYDLARLEGFEGSPTDFLESLKGPQGEPGGGGSASSSELFLAELLTFDTDSAGYNNLWVGKTILSSTDVIPDVEFRWFDFARTGIYEICLVGETGAVNNYGDPEAITLSPIGLDIKIWVGYSQTLPSNSTSRLRTHYVDEYTSDRAMGFSERFYMLIDESSLASEHVSVSAIVISADATNRFKTRMGVSIKRIADYIPPA